MNTSIKDLVIRGADILNEGKFDFDRTKYLNGSEAGTCIRKQWYSKKAPQLGEPQNWGFARRGSHGEKFLVEALIAANVPLHFAGAEQVSYQDEKRKISSTPDGLIKYDDVWVVPEFKTIDPRTNKSKLPRKKDVLQLQIAMEMISRFVYEERLDKSVEIPIKGKLVYMDASNYYEIQEFWVQREPKILDRMAKRASKILRTKSVDNLDREGKRDGGNECKTMCPFSTTCLGKSGAGEGRRRSNRGSNLDGSAIRFMALKDQEADIKAEKSDLSEDIKDGLKERKLNKTVVGDITISLSEVKGKIKLDKKAIKAAGIDLTPYETTGAPSERLLVERA